MKEVNVSTSRLSQGIEVDVDFEAFYRANYQRTVRLAWLLSNGSSASEDVAQDAFLRLHRRFGEVASPAAYLRTTVVNLGRDARRRQLRHEARIHLLIGADDGNPHDAHLLELVAELPYAQRAVLVLRYWAGLPDQQIAQALGVRPATVRSLAHRATRRLRRELSDDS